LFPARLDSFKLRSGRRLCNVLLTLAVPKEVTWRRNIAKFSYKRAMLRAMGAFDVKNFSAEAKGV
jgi:hypothetical protein